MMSQDSPNKTELQAALQAIKKGDLALKQKKLEALKNF